MTKSLARFAFLPLSTALAIATAFAGGCSGEKGGPTKIYEGGGTIPEIVDQPEKPEAAAKKR